MKNKFVIGNDKVFRIEASTPKSLTSCIVIGDENNNLEIIMDSDTSCITSIESLYVDNILNENLYLPNFKEDKSIAKILYPNFSYDKDNPPTYIFAAAVCSLPRGASMMVAAPGTPEAA